MARDFLSNQIKTKQIIGSGEGAISGSQGNPKLMVYADTDASDSIGGLNANILDNVGDDVFLFVSGTINGKENQTDNTVTLFGGDVVISGTLYSERHVVEVDATTTGSLQVSGSITHSEGINIGTAPDQDYSDGLFKDFNSNTLLGDVVDRFNSVLAELAPSSPPSLSTIDARSSFEQASSAYLSFGVSNDQVANGYFNVVNTIADGDPIDSLHFNAIDINQLYEPESESSRFHKLGVFQGNTTFVGELNYHVDADVYSNGVVNYSEDAFSNADEGTLTLYLNNQPIHELNLNSYVDQEDPNSLGNSLNPNGSGFFSIKNKLNTKFSNGNSFDVFNYRTCSWILSPNDQVNGFNYVCIVHQIGNVKNITTVSQWVNDNNSDNLTASNTSLLMTGDSNTIKTISGVKYFRSASLDYSTNIDNFYKFVFGKDNVTFTSQENSENAVLNFQDFVVPEINTGIGENYTKVLNITTSSNLGLPASNRIITDNSTGVSLEANITHPLKSIDSNQTVSYARGILIDNVVNSSSETSENFDDEDYRILSGSYNNQSETNLMSWSSTVPLNSGNSNYEKGLLVHNGKLISTNNDSISSLINFSSLDNSPSNNVDYSSNMLSTPKIYMRKFTNNTGSAIRDFSYNILGTGRFIEGTTLGNRSTDFNLSFKIPGQTGWLDAAKDFVYNDTNDNDGGNIGNLNNVVSNNPENYFSFGVEELQNSENIVLRIISNYSWQGEVDNIEIDFTGGAANTNIINPTITDNLLSSLQGSTAKLSFGESLVKSQIIDSYDYTTSTLAEDIVTISASPGLADFESIQYSLHNEFISSSLTGTFILSNVANENYFSLETPDVISSTTLLATQFNVFVYELSDPNDLSTNTLKELPNPYSNYIYGIELEESTNYYFWKLNDGNWYYSKDSFPYVVGSEAYETVAGINAIDSVDVNEIYTQENVTNSQRKGIFDNSTVITATINEDVSGQGTNSNNFIDNSWGRGEAHKGSLILEINGVTYKTIDLTNLSLSGEQLTDNSGFNITSAVVSKDNNGLPDYRYFYRTGTIKIDPEQQRLGWNYARVIHDNGNGTIDQTNYIEWVNNDTTGPDFSPVNTSILENSISESSNTSSDSLSGIFYYNTPVGILTQEVNDVYKYIYSSSADAISFSNSNVSVNSIEVSGQGVINSTVNSSFRSLPNLDTNVVDAYDKSITIETDFTYLSTKSLPGSLTSASMNCTVKHPANDRSSGQINLPSPIIYRITDTSTNAVEDFSAESYRLQESVFSNQAALSGLSWDSSISLIDPVESSHNTGLQVYDNKLIYPNINFSTIESPVLNPDYSNVSGERTFYRKFQNTTLNSQFGFSLRIKGANTTISSVDLSDPANSLSANEIKVYAKIPTTSNSQTTGFMDLGKPFNSGQTADNDGCLQGSLNSNIINTGTGTSNTVTFGSSFLSPNDYVIIKIVADDSWSGELNRIEVVWS